MPIRSLNLQADADNSPVGFETHATPMMTNTSMTAAMHISTEKLRCFVHDAARRLDIPENQAALLAQLLTASDLRGVFSHGSRQMLRYTREIRDDVLNAQPDVRCVRETPTSLVMDGDGGLGYFPAYEGTLRLIEKAEQQGMAAMVTRNHGHIGAAGIYTRLAVEHDLIAFATSGAQLKIKSGNRMYKAVGGAPMSFSAPAGREPALVVDAGVTNDLDGDAPHRDQIEQLAPRLVLRAIGYGAVCQAWGGLLAGLPVDLDRADRRYAAASQGAMLFACKIALFADPDQFKREMDEYVQRVRQLKPIPGTEGAFLAGDVEARREVAFGESGIPVSLDHRRDLETLARDLELRVPWS